jgi:hypothetical protein
VLDARKHGRHKFVSHHMRHLTLPQSDVRSSVRDTPICWAFR